MIDVQNFIDLYRQRTNITSFVLLIANSVCLFFSLPSVLSMIENDGALYLCNILICSLCLFWGFKCHDYIASSNQADIIKKTIRLEHVNTNEFINYINSASSAISRITDFLRYIFISWIFLYASLLAIWYASRPENQSLEMWLNQYLNISSTKLNNTVVPCLLNGINVFTSYYLVKIYYVLNSNHKKEQAIHSLSFINFLSVFIYLVFLFIVFSFDHSKGQSILPITLISSLIFGTIGCVTFSLVLARLESKFTVTKKTFFLILFLYAAIQMVYPIILLTKPSVSAINNELNNTIFLITNFFILFAFIAKTIFYSLFHRVISTHRIFIYFLKSYSDQSSISELDKLSAILKSNVNK